MTDFLNGLEKELNNTQTWNGAKAYSSTLNANLDLFGKIAACRGNIPQAIALFHAAYKENPETATRILFYSRDIRSGQGGQSGQGERAVFKALLKELAITNSVVVRRLLSLVPFYGRWDDLLVLEDTSSWQDVMSLITSQLSRDLAALEKNEPISLLAKWLPSINASSKDSKRLGKKIAKEFDVTEKEYRHILVSLRSKIAIVEQLMCAKEWSEINYEHVPSKAGLMYRKAFGKHDGDRYGQYLEDVKKGEKKINASTLYPYDICFPAIGSDYYRTSPMTEMERNSLDVMWNALPNYMEGAEFNGLVLADVSGSMYTPYSKKSKIRPIDVSLSLAVYIAEKNSGIWKDSFLAFHSEPKLVKLSGKDIYSKLQCVKSSTTHMGSTNLIGAIRAVLDTGVKNNLSPEEMPKTIIIVSDMQFDQSCSSNKRTNFEQMKKFYEKAGYEMPKVIFWNVNASSNVPVTMHDTGTGLVSGCSPSILKTIFSSKMVTPVDLMLDAVYVERYDLIGEFFKYN